MKHATETHQEEAQHEVNRDSLQAGSAPSTAERSPADYARELHDWGLHVLPLHRGEKRPIGAAWQERSRDENLGLFARTPRAGLGFIPGLTIDPDKGEPVCLVHVDVDGDDAYSWFLEQVPQEFRDRTVAWRSPRGGYGFVYRIPVDSPLVDRTTVTIWSQRDSTSSERAKEEVQLRIQKSNGVLPPTTVLINGEARKYSWLRGAKRFEDFSGPASIPLAPAALLERAEQRAPSPPQVSSPPTTSDGYFDAVRTVTAAIEAIPAEAVWDYDDALRIGMMIHSALSDETGFKLWDILCRKTESRYFEKPTWTREKWKTFRQDGNDTGRLTIASLVDEARRWDSGFSPTGTRGGSKQSGGVVHKLMKAVLTNPDIEVFHSRRDKQPYVRLRHRGRWQTHSLDSAGGLSLLRHLLSSNDAPPSTRTFDEAVQLLRTHARHEAPARDVFFRVAHAEGAVYVDLGDETFHSVEVTASGWRVVEEPPVLFVRSRTTRALARPEAGGSLDDFRPFFPTDALEDLRLLLTYLTDTFLAPPNAARPLLVFDGPPGSAKTTMTGFATALTDPQTGSPCAPSKNEENLAIAASHCHVLAFDNASRISWSLSDALCRLATGGGLRTRKFYSNEDEVVFDDVRHVILNSVGDVVRQNDLRDRAVFILTARVEHSRDDAELKADFERAQGRLFGVLLDAVVAGLANQDSIDTSHVDLPRMAGFAKRGMACAGALEWSPNAFLDAYQENIDRATADHLENDLVAQALLSVPWNDAKPFLRDRLQRTGVAPTERDAALDWESDVVWRGTASDLKDYIEHIDSHTTWNQDWPREVRLFGRYLKLSADAVRKAGLELEFARCSRERTITIRRVTADGSQPKDTAGTPTWGDLV